MVRVVLVKLAMLSLVAGALSVAAQANAEPFTFYADRASFLAAVGESITDDYTAYGFAPGMALRPSLPMRR